MSQLQDWTRRRNWAKLQITSCAGHLRGLLWTARGLPDTINRLPPPDILNDTSEWEKLDTVYKLLEVVIREWENNTCQLKENLPKTSS